MKPTANNLPCRLVWKSNTDGYFYENEAGELLRCDHSCDDRFGVPQGPDACEHGVLFVDIARILHEGITLVIGARAAPLPIKGGCYCLVDVDKGLQYIMNRYPAIQLFAEFGASRFQMRLVN